MNNKIPVIAVPTQEISEIVQKKLFELGYRWVYGGDIEVREMQYGKEEYIAIHNDKTLMHNVQVCYLEDHKDIFYEITMYDLYQMEAEEKKVSIKIEVNGKPVDGKLSLETARNLGIVE